MKTTGGRLVVRALEDEDIPFTFGIPGTHNIELYDAIAESEKVRPILVTDEQAASFMADAVWRASGRLGCANLVPGAGVTHAMSGIAEAWMDNVPMLVLTCGIRTDTGRAFQLHDVDQLAMLAPVTKAQIRVLDGARLYDEVRRACAIAREGVPGPVVVEVPANLYLFRHDSEPPAVGDPPSAFSNPPSARAAQGPDAGSLGRAVDILKAARRPLLYVGLGAQHARDRLVELAERLEMPVASTFQGKGVFPESHPLFLWPGFGDAAPAFVRKVVAGCDATLAIGCRFGEVATGSYGLTPPGKLVHVDIDPDVPGANFAVEAGITADAAAFVDALLTALADSSARVRDDDMRERIARGHAAVVEEWREQAAASQSVAPYALISALQRRLGPDTIYCTDSGNGTFLAMEQLRLDSPGKFLGPIDYSCMGYSVPAAVGASLAQPESRVVALAGDGAFLMTGLELATAASHEVPFAMFLLRDRELAQIAQFQDTALSRKTASLVSDYDLASLAAALGVECVRLDRNDEIEATLDVVERALAERRPIAVDVAIDYSRKTYFTNGVVKTNLRRLPLGDRVRFISRAIGRRLLPAR